LDHCSAWNEGLKKKIWASKKLESLAQTFCDIFFMKKRLIVFFINNIKINSCTSLTGVGEWGGRALQGNFGRYRCAAEIAKHPNAYIAIK
jgi:hypothetical protein